MGDERLYTLDQAREEIGRRQCAARGHDWEILNADGSPKPVALVCISCGSRLPVGHGCEVAGRD